MADLLTRPLLRRDEPAWGSRVPWLAAMAAAGWSLVASLAMSALPAVAIWISEGAAAPMGEPLRFGARVWLAAHRIGLDVDGGAFAFAPLGLTIVFVLLMHRSARWAAHSAGVSTTRGAAAVVIPATLTYALGAGVVAGMSATPDVASTPLEAVGWAGLWSLGAMTVGVGHEAGLLSRWFARIPELARISLAGGAAATAGLLAVGSLLTVVSAIANSGRVGELANALDAGVLGSAVLAVGGAIITPNAVVWAASFAMGPGFAVGAGTSVSPAGVELGLVPAVPALGALPAALPGWITWLVLAGPLLAGVVAGLTVSRHVRPATNARWFSPGPDVGAAAASGLVAAVAMGLLAFLSGGSAGADRLTEIGPVPWQAAAVAALFVGVPAVVVVRVLGLRPDRSEPETPDVGASDDNESSGDSATADQARKAGPPDQAKAASDPVVRRDQAARQKGTTPPPPPPPAS